LPYYDQHPEVRKVFAKAKEKRLLSFFSDMHHLCDSDKYSMVVSFESIVNFIPRNIIEVLEQSDVSSIAMNSMPFTDDVQSSAFIRRVYLQNLYRFHKVFPVRSEFYNPFAKHDNILFFANALFAETKLTDHWQEIVSFLVKRKYYNDAQSVLWACYNKSDSFLYQLTLGTVQYHLGGQAIKSFKRALSIKPDNVRALAGLARAAFEEELYEESLECYERLLDIDSENKTYTLNKAVCLLNLNRSEEALKLLYKLNYLDANDVKINRVLAWALMTIKNYEQAERIYQQLNNKEKPQYNDALNYGYCLWFMRKVQAAIEQFKKTKETFGIQFDVEFEFMDSEYNFIKDHGIDDVDIRLMTDALTP